MGEGEYNWQAHPNTLSRDGLCLHHILYISSPLNSSLVPFIQVQKSLPIRIKVQSCTTTVPYNLSVFSYFKLLLPLRMLCSLTCFLALLTFLSLQKTLSFLIASTHVHLLVLLVKVWTWGLRLYALPDITSQHQGFKLPPPGSSLSRLDPRTSPRHNLN